MLLSPKTYLHPTQVHLFVCYAQDVPSPSCPFHRPMVCSPTQQRTLQSLLVLQQNNHVTIGTSMDVKGQFPAAVFLIMHNCPICKSSLNAGGGVQLLLLTYLLLNIYSTWHQIIFTPYLYHCYMITTLQQNQRG